jgi:hypothetical protein
MRATGTPKVATDWVHGHLVYVEKSAHPRRWLDAIGPNVVKVIDRFMNSGLASADAPLGWTVTLVEAGAGESTITKPDGVDAGILLTTDANEDDGIGMQLKGEGFKASTACKGLYFYARLQANEATQSDFLVGLCITDTTLLGGMTDGIYFEKLDGGTGISCVTEKDSTETQTDNVGTFAADTDVTLEFFFDGTRVFFFVNGTLVATHTTNIPDDEELTPSLQFLAGSTTAKTLAWKEVRAIQVGY